MTQTISVSNPLGTERIEKLIVRFSIPSIISIVVNSLYNMVDQVFIGQSVGYLGNAATNIILPLTVIMLAISMLIGDGTASYMSLNLGKGRERSAAYGVGNAVTLLIGISVVLLIAFEIFLQPLCLMFGATEANLHYALEYGRIIIFAFPFAMIDAAFGSIIRADNRPKISMIGLLIGCVINIILDPIFIFVFNWGVKGAALATVIGQILNAFYFIACMRRFQSFELSREHLIIKVSVIKKILTLGISSFITQIASVLVIAVMNNLLVKYGELSKYGADIPLAVLGIIMKISQLVTGVALGISVGIQPILGYNYGSGQYDRVKRTYMLALKSSTVILIIAFFIFQFWPEQIISIFGKESELYVEFAVKCFRIYLLACFMIGAGAVTGIFFQAIGKPVPAALLSLSRQIIFLLPAMLILSYFMGIDGVLWAGPFGDGLSGIVSLITVGVCWKKIFQKEVLEK